MNANLSNSTNEYLFSGYFGKLEKSNFNDGTNKKNSMKKIKPFSEIIDEDYEIKMESISSKFIFLYIIFF